MFGPLAEAVQVKGVPTDGSASCSGIALDDLHVANSAQILFVLVFFFENNVSAGYFDFGVLEKVFYFVVVNSATGDDVSEFFIVVAVSKEQGVVFWDVEDVREYVESVWALMIIGFFAGAFEFVADGDLKLGAVNVFEDEAGPAGDAD